MTPLTRFCSVLGSTLALWVPLTCLLPAGAANLQEPQATLGGPLRQPPPENSAGTSTSSAAGPRPPPAEERAPTPHFRVFRGVTIGPIENALHPDRGYGSKAYQATLDEVVRMGGNFVSLTPFGRVWDLAPTGIARSFEAPFEENRRAVALAIEQAHERGLKVMLVPHLWVETGGWRAEIDPGDDEAWQRWSTAYRRWVLQWADMAAKTNTEVFAMGVELRSWVTTTHAPTFVPLIREVRATYRGLLTYAANWDDAELTTIWGELDVIGINAFYPLTDKPNATLPDLIRGGVDVKKAIGELAAKWKKPILFTEFGYTTRPEPALRPWEWPEHVGRVQIDQKAQEEAYFSLLQAFIDEPWFHGFFVWRAYADPNDVSQEPEWGFSPRGKAAELVLRDAFRTEWARDTGRLLGHSLMSRRARTPGVF